MQKHRKINGINFYPAQALPGRDFLYRKSKIKIPQFLNQMLSTAFKQKSPEKYRAIVTQKSYTH